MINCSSGFNNRSSYLSFKGAKDINLNYIIKNRAYLLPERMIDVVENVLKTQCSEMPTLLELHKSTYEPLLKCKNLDEAKRLFPEFSDVKQANDVFQRNTGNIKRLAENNFLDEKFSLRVLQGLWAKLQTQDELARTLGLKDRRALGWVLSKIEIKGCGKNYKNLLKSSDEKLNKEIAEKTRVWNASHPDFVEYRNKCAIDALKKPENREASSLRMKKFYEENPQKRKEVSEKSKKYWSDPKNREEQSLRGKNYNKLHPELSKLRSERSKAAWDRIPEMRKVMSSFYSDYVAEDKVLAVRLNNIFMKNSKGEPLSESERKLILKFNKDCMQAHPEIRIALKEAYMAIREEKLNEKLL